MAEPQRANGAVDPAASTPDLVVVGASAGGVEALQRLVRGLPADLPAAVLVVLHVSSSGSQLAGILDRAGPLPARWAVTGDRIRAGEVVVAVPDHHLVVTDGHVELTRGPRENGSRPAVDVLFRSAAQALGPRVVGVVLSGTLDDGAAGLLAISRAGGVAVVQDPADAQHDRMPQAALGAVPTALRLRGGDVPSALVTLLRDRGVAGDDPAGRPADPATPSSQASPADPGPSAESGEQAFEAAGGSRVLTCPECAGPLLLVENGEVGPPRYACRVGHAYSADSLVEANAQAVERALWTAVQTLEERAELTGDLARRAADRHHHRSAAAYAARAADVTGAAQVVRELIASGAAAAPYDDEVGPGERTAAPSPRA